MRKKNNSQSANHLLSKNVPMLINNRSEKETSLSILLAVHQLLEAIES